MLRVLPLQYLEGEALDKSRILWYAVMFLVNWGKTEELMNKNARFLQVSHRRPGSFADLYARMRALREVHRLRVVRKDGKLVVGRG